MTVSEQIVSYIKSTPALQQASHAKVLQDNPGFALVLGLGYNEVQVPPPPTTTTTTTGRSRTTSPTTHTRLLAVCLYLISHLTCTRFSLLAEAQSRLRAPGQAAR
jgi:hypothetical protein